MWVCLEELAWQNKQEDCEKRDRTGWVAALRDCWCAHQLLMENRDGMMA